MKTLIPLLIMLVTATVGCSGQAQDISMDDPETSQDYYAIETSFGRMVVKLYDETPLHRDNFAKLVDEGFYDNTAFHRVINNFMIQGGDPNSKDDDPYNDGMGGPGYTVPAEFNPDLFHKKGALSAARQGGPINPERRSSGSQFYVVHGQVMMSEQITQVEQGLKQKFGPDFAFKEEAKVAYATVGGTPFLDMDYTVFGEVVEGFDVLDAIAATPTTTSTGQASQLQDRPLEDVRMTIKKLSGYTPE